MIWYDMIWYDILGHPNSLDYNPSLDQIVLSNFAEATTTTTTTTAAAAMTTTTATTTRLRLWL